jgi:hypothetical protein
MALRDIVSPISANGLWGCSAKRGQNNVVQSPSYIEGKDLGGALCFIK